MNYRPSCVAAQKDMSLLNINDLNTEAAESSYTGQVGTVLYAAPELSTGASNIHYNQVRSLCLEYFGSLLFYSIFTIVRILYFTIVCRKWTFTA